MRKYTNAIQKVREVQKREERGRGSLTRATDVCDECYIVTSALRANA